MTLEIIGVPPSTNNGTDGSLYNTLRNAPLQIPDSGASEYYGVCAYPATDDDYEQRANATDCSCELTWVYIYIYQAYTSGERSH